MPWSPGPLFSPNVTICMKHPSRTDSALSRMSFACFRNSGYTTQHTLPSYQHHDSKRHSMTALTPREFFLRPLTANFPLSKQWPMSVRGESSRSGEMKPPLPFLGGVGPNAGSSKGICSPGHSVKLERGAPECGCARRLQINLPVSRHCL